MRRRAPRQSFGRNLPSVRLAVRPQSTLAAPATARPLGKRGLRLNFSQIRRWPGGAVKNSAAGAGVMRTGKRESGLAGHLLCAPYETSNCVDKRCRLDWLSKMLIETGGG